LTVALTVSAHREPGVLGEHQYHFTEAGLVESTRVSETLLKWGGVRALLRTRGCLYVRVTSLRFHSIPRRFFSSGVAYDEFWKSLQPLVAKKDS
jgi:hypothetical protein